MVININILKKFAILNINKLMYANIQEDAPWWMLLIDDKVPVDEKRSRSNAKLDLGKKASERTKA